MNSSHHSRIVALIAALCLVLGCNDTMVITNPPHIPPDNIQPVLPPFSSSCNADTVYFLNDVYPVVTALCGKSGCHGAVNPHVFSLTTYSQIAFRMGSTSKLVNMLVTMNKLMFAAYIPPNAGQLDTLQKWISQGATNNRCLSCDTTRYSYAAVIAPIFSTYCTGCHTGPSAQRTVDLSTYAGIQADISQTAYPGELLGSIQQVPGGHYYNSATSMPPGAKLPACQIAQIQKWISAGAPNN